MARFAKLISLDERPGEEFTLEQIVAMTGLKRSTISAKCYGNGRSTNRSTVGGFTPRWSNNFEPTPERVEFEREIQKAQEFSRQRNRLARLTGGYMHLTQHVVESLSQARMLRAAAIRRSRNIAICSQCDFERPRKSPTGRVCPKCQSLRWSRPTPMIEVPAA